MSSSSLSRRYQLFTMFFLGSAPELLLISVILLTLTGKVTGHERIPGPDVKKVSVKEDRDVILPCSLETMKNIEQDLFDWRKIGQPDAKEVFMYDGGDHYNNGRPGQDEKFKGRVSHFPDQLKYGNASIIIRNTTVTDSGNYTCDFPRLQPNSQIFHIELVVEFTIKDRSAWIDGAAREPNIQVLDATDDGVRLQCDVQGAFPKPKVEWKDRAGNILPAEEPQVSYRGERYYITLLTTVTKTDHYHCVVTQEEIHLQTEAKTYVFIHGAAPKPNIQTLDATKDWSLLQCEVQGAFPEPKVEWKDRAGNILPAEEPQVSYRGERYYITLRTTVTKTDHYHCVVKQEEIFHQTEAETFVFIHEWKDSSGNIVPADEPKVTDRGGSYDIINATVTNTNNSSSIVTQKEINHQTKNDIDLTHGNSTGWIVAAVLSTLLLLLVLVVGGVLYHKGIIKVNRRKSRRPHENGYEKPSVVGNEQGNGLHTETLLPGSDVPAQTSPV